jgi:periplasmic protein CpxP/Spy
MKKNAIRFLIVAFALAALSLPVLAQAGQGEGQGRRRGMPSIDQRVQRLTKMLNLNDDQQAKVKSILADQQNQMTALRQDTSMSQQDRRAKFMQIHQDTQDKLRGVLNDQQKAKFDQIQARRKERWQKQRGQGDTGSPEKQ